MTIAVLMMVKNEQKRLLVTLESVKDFATCLIVYDTGSTDNTVAILKTFSRKYRLPLFLKRGVFVDFSTSRNVLLDFADSHEEIDYYLLLDTNDELIGSKKLAIFLETVDPSISGFYIRQVWKSSNLRSFYNYRLIKSKSNWKYIGKVHEYLQSPNKTPIKLSEDIYIYQDRTKDDNKSQNRFSTDYKLLLSDYKQNPQNPRTLFYLAQTCNCLERYEEAINYYSLRIEQRGFSEECFESAMSCGRICKKLDRAEDATGWFLRALEIDERVEPATELANYYRNLNKWKVAFMFIDFACSLEYPKRHLFVDRGVYDYWRWHYMGIIGFYAKEYEKGYRGATIASKVGWNLDLDAYNRKFYLNKIGEDVEEIKNGTTTSSNRERS